MLLQIPNTLFQCLFITMLPFLCLGFASPVMEQSDTNLRYIQFQNVLELSADAGAVTALSWSSDDTKIAAGYEEGDVLIWDAASSAIANTLHGHEAQVWSVAWMSNGEQVASGGADYAVRLSNLETKQTRNLYSHEAVNYGVEPGVYSVAWSNTGSLASVGSDQTLKILSDGHLTSFGIDFPDQVRGAGRAVTWSSTDRLLATFMQGAELWDTAHWQQIRVFRCGEDSLVIDGVLSPDGRFVEVSNNNNELCIWDAQTAALETLITFPAYAIRSAWRPDNLQLAVLVRNPENAMLTSLYVMDAVTGETLGVISEHPDAQTLAWSPDGTRLATGGRDGIIRIWTLIGH